MARDLHKHSQYVALYLVSFKNEVHAFTIIVLKNNQKHANKR